MPWLKSARACIAVSEPPFYRTERLVTIQPEDVVGPHVNNARFFTFINLAFTDWYAGLGIGLGAAAGPAMARIEYDFLHEVFYPGRLICRLTVDRVGRASLDHRIEMLDPDRDMLLCGQGRAVNVWTDRAAHRPAPWPPEVLARCWPDAAQAKPAL